MRLGVMPSACMDLNAACAAAVLASAAGNGAAWEVRGRRLSEGTRSQGGDPIRYSAVPAAAAAQGWVHTCTGLEQHEVGLPVWPHA